METLQARRPRPVAEAEQVVAWLRSPEGERWSRDRIGESLRSHDLDVYLAEVIPDRYGRYAAASWPEPLPRWDLDAGDVT
jgi:hypothetical protein